MWFFPVRFSMRCPKCFPSSFHAALSLFVASSVSPPTPGEHGHGKRRVSSGGQGIQLCQRPQLAFLVERPHFAVCWMNCAFAGDSILDEARASFDLLISGTCLAPSWPLLSVVDRAMFKSCAAPYLALLLIDECSLDWKRGNASV